MAFAAFGSAPANANTGQNLRGGKIVLALLLPGLLYLAIFFMTPLVSLVITSLEAPDPSGMIGSYQYGFEIQNYIGVLTDYMPQILRSFLYAIVATLLALLISYPLAYFIGVKIRRYPLIQRLAVTLVIAPFFISFLLHTIAWKQLLADGTPLMQWLHEIGVLAPSQYFIGTPAAVIFGLTYNFIPFMTLPLYTTLERFDVRLLEAGSDLYASPSKVFRKITLPISMPGIISGTLLTFIPIAGDYVNASRDFLGSSKTSMIGNMVEADFLQNLRYPAASALSVLLMAVILILVTFYVKKSGTEDLL
jgi:spermidine/putrescine transport system permease protein